MAQLLTAFLRGFPHSKADSETVAVYVLSLDDYSPIEIRAAMAKLCRTAKFFPTIAEICEAIESIKATVSQTKGELSAGEAWEAAMRNVRENHVYKPWEYPTPEFEQAVKQFGKAELCNLREDAVNTARAQFIKIYDGCVRRSREKKLNLDVLKKMGVDVDIKAIDGKSGNGNDAKRLIEAIGGRISGDRDMTGM